MTESQDLKSLNTVFRKAKEVLNERGWRGAMGTFDCNSSPHPVCLVTAVDAHPRDRELKPFDFVRDHLGIVQDSPFLEKTLFAIFDLNDNNGEQWCRDTLDELIAATDD